jgi:hypothetical protein
MALWGQAPAWRGVEKGLSTTFTSAKVASFPGNELSVWWAGRHLPFCGQLESANVARL